MPEPQDPRGEVSENDVSRDGTSSSAGASDEAIGFEWPAEDPGESGGGASGKPSGTASEVSWFGDGGSGAASGSEVTATGAQVASGSGPGSRSESSSGGGAGPTSSSGVNSSGATGDAEAASRAGAAAGTGLGESTGTERAAQQARGSERTDGGVVEAERDTERVGKRTGQSNAGSAETSSSESAERTEKPGAEQTAERAEKSGSGQDSERAAKPGPGQAAGSAEKPSSGVSDERSDSQASPEHTAKADAEQSGKPRSPQGADQAGAPGAPRGAVPAAKPGARADQPGESDSPAGTEQVGKPGVQPDPDKPGAGQNAGRAEKPAREPAAKSGAQQGSEQTSKSGSPSDAESAGKPSIAEQSGNPGAERAAKPTSRPDDEAAEKPASETDTERPAKSGQQTAERGAGESSGPGAEQEGKSRSAPATESEVTTSSRQDAAVTAKSGSRSGTERIEKPSSRSGAEQSGNSGSPQGIDQPGEEIARAGPERSARSSSPQGAKRTGAGTERLANSDAELSGEPSTQPGTERIEKPSSQSDAERSGSSGAEGAGTADVQPGGERDGNSSAQAGTERIEKAASERDAEQQSEKSGAEQSGRSGAERSGAAGVQPGSERGGHSSAEVSGKASAQPGTERIEKPSAQPGIERVEKPDAFEKIEKSAEAEPAEETQQLAPVSPEDSTQPHPLGQNSAPEAEEPTEHIEVPEDLTTSEAPAAGDSSLVETGAPLLPKPVRLADDPPPQPQPISASSSQRRPHSLRSHGRLLVAWLSALVVLGVVVGVLIGSNGLQQLRTASPPSPVQLHPLIHPVNTGSPVPSQRSLGAALAGPASSPAVGNFAGQVLDAQTGQQLWQQNGTQPMTPASTGKLFALSAALLEFEPQHRFTTKVVRGPVPGSVVLVGGGDPTLSTLPVGQKSIYQGAAGVDDLANQVRAATGGHVSQVLVDSSRYAGPQMAPGWDNSDIAGGSVAPIQPVMVNGGRSDPTGEESPRTPTPALQAGQELAKRIGAPVGAVSEGAAPQRAQPLGEVRSPTVRDMVESVLTHSDNVGAETLAREVAIRTGSEPSFAGGAKAVRDVLTRHGLAVHGVQMQDGSGLSKDDRARPSDIAAIMEGASSPANDDRTRRLRDLLPGLPVAGGTGTLADRYHDSQARGWVRAKTGTLNGANGLTGTALTHDGRLLAFAFLSNGPSSSQARPGLDKIAEALRGCGCR